MVSVEPIVRESASIEHTRTIASDLASVLRARDIVLLTGEIGAGKTTLVRELCGILNIDQSLVSSPTFVIMQNYERADGFDIAHLDCTRLESIDDLDTLGFEHAMESGAVALIEWGERVEARFENALRITIEHTGETDRRFTIIQPASWDDRAGIGALKSKGWTVCPSTGERVHPESPSWPFADERSRMHDLHGWMSESFRIPKNDADPE